MENQKIEEIHKMLEDGTKRFRSSEAWKQYLSMQSKLPDYSSNNCMLIMLQSQGKATMCMGFNSWKKLGRTVKAGEKGLRILCPSPRKIVEEQEKKDAFGNIVLKADGTPEKERITRVIPAYKIGYTFDVSQTEGASLPEICHRLDGSVEGAKQLIEALMNISPVPISFEAINGSANGYYSPSEKRIVVSNDLLPNHKIHTCLHEITHATLDLNGTDKDATRGMKETEAESVAFVVMKNLLGDQLTTEDLGRYSFGYLNSWASSDDLTEMKQAMKVIQKTSLNLIDRVKAELKRMDEENKKIAAYSIRNCYLFMHRNKNGYDFKTFDEDFRMTGEGTKEALSARMDEAAKCLCRQMGRDTWQMRNLSPEILTGKVSNTAIAVKSSHHAVR